MQDFRRLCVHLMLCSNKLRAVGGQGERHVGWGGRSSKAGDRVAYGFNLCDNMAD